MGERKMKGILDVIVGGQYGDCGKGSACLMLDRALSCGKEHEYLASVRVGASQAEHRFVYENRNYRFRVLPCLGALGDVDLLLGSGHVIRPDMLEQELDTYNIERGRVLVDSQAAIVYPKQRQESKKTASYGRGGYSIGVSQTRIEKLRRKNRDILASSYYFDTPITVGNVKESLHDRLKVGQNVLVEGSQGALLSLNHGQYPYVTSADVTAPAILGEIGVGWQWVRDVYAVYRYNPVRVAGNSGDAGGKELSWDDIEHQCGHSIPENRKHQSAEDGSYDGNERIFEWSWEEFRQSLIMNTPTKMILTHADWVSDIKDIEVRIKNMEHIAENVLGYSCKVRFVRCGERIDNYIDLGW